jgi:hypothetical protein
MEVLRAWRSIIRAVSRPFRSPWHQFDEDHTGWVAAIELRNGEFTRTKEKGLALQVNWSIAVFTMGD